MRLAGLPRVSSEDRETLGSIATQCDKMEMWAKVHDHEIVAWFKDEDVSGLTDLRLRPEGGRLVREIEGTPKECRRFDGIVVYRLDRLGRSFKTIFDGLDLFERHRIEFLSATESFDTVTPAGRAMLGMLATFSGFERDTFMQRTRDGKAQWAKAGCWLGGIVPYGYTLASIEGRRFLVPSSEILEGCRWSEQDVVALIYRWIAEEQLTSYQVARRLIAHGVPTHSQLAALRPGRKRNSPARGNWQPSKIRAMLTNPTYKGLHVFGGKPNQKMPAQARAVPPIVEESLWDAAHRQMAKNREKSGRPTETEYLLKGLLICSYCRCRYIGTKWPFGKRCAAGVHYYKCGGKHAASSPGTEYLRERGCRSRALPGPDLEEQVWKSCLWVIEHADDVVTAIRTEHGDTALECATLQERLDEGQRRLGDLAMEEEGTITLMLKRKITEAQMDAQRERIAAERAMIVEELAALRTRKTSLDENRMDDLTTGAAMAELAGLVARDHLTFEEKQFVVRTLIKRVEVEAPTTPGRSPNPEPIFQMVGRGKAISDCISTDDIEFCLPIAGALALAA